MQFVTKLLEGIALWIWLSIMFSCIYIPKVSFQLFKSKTIDDEIATSTIKRLYTDIYIQTVTYLMCIPNCLRFEYLHMKADSIGIKKTKSSLTQWNVDFFCEY